MKRALSMQSTFRIFKILTCSSRPSTLTTLSSCRWFSKKESPVLDTTPDFAEPSTIGKLVEKQSVKDILSTASIGDLVRIQGWVRAFRKQKQWTFMDISDGSSIHVMPVILKSKVMPRELSMHCSVDIVGYLHANPKLASIFEIHPSQPLVIVGKCDHDQYPLRGKAAYEIEYIRQFWHLRPKTNLFSSLFRLRSIATKGISDYFHDNDFIQVHTPILTSNDCEGAGEVFMVRPANENLMLDRPILPQSGPLAPRPINPVKVDGLQSHEHKDVPDDGQKYTHSHTCVECGTTFEHTHSKKPTQVSQTYDNHYCDEHKHLRKETTESPSDTVKIANPVPPIFNPDTSFFDRKVYLTVSSQLHLEAFASGIDKVWSFSPVFRCENSKSIRHLSEFYMVEAEISFVTRIEQLLQVMESLVKFVVKRIVYDNSTEWNTFTSSNLHQKIVANSSTFYNQEIKTIMEKVITRPFSVMTYEEASNLLASKADSPVNPTQGLSREQELLLVEKLNDNIPIFVINWPSSIKPFYMKRLPDDESLCSAVDLLVPSVGELCGGSLRENDLSLLKSRIRTVDPSGKLLESLDWYLDLRRFGSVPTAGFGLGFDRLLQLMLGVSNIKDVTAFPRWPHNCSM